MEIFQGKEGFGKVALGTIKVIRKSPSPGGWGITRQDDEFTRYEKARQTVLEDLRHDSPGSKLMIMEDHQLDDAIKARILYQGCSAQEAISGAGKYMEQMLTKHPDQYLASKSGDIKQLSKLLLSSLEGYGGADAVLPDDCIVVADVLTTSDFLKLDKKKLKGLVVERSSVNSHMAILAKATGVPTILGCDISDEWNGKSACVDGGWRALYIEPDDLTTVDMQHRIDDEKKKEEELKNLRGHQCMTRSGRLIHIYANISSVYELRSVLENDAEGIGLYRTEQSFINRENAPLEEELYLEYKTIALEMGNRGFCIRTVDLAPGRDAPYLPFYGETNPSMGIRGIRLCLKYPDIIKPQLRAILRAAVYGNIAIMFPLVSSMEELSGAKQILEECGAELTAQDIPFKHVRVGIMAETPAAVMISDELAKNCDFISIGTNDLTQYALGVDRENKEMAEFCDYHHPAIMKMIKIVVDNCNKANTPVGICGELAAEDKAVPELLKAGIENISIMPSRVLPIRSLISNLD